MVDINPSNFSEIKITANSSLVENIEYDKHARKLFVSYKSGKRKGKVKAYDDVSLPQFLDLLSAESIGKAVIKLAKESKKDYLN